MIRVLHIITSLRPDGAETMLLKLASAMDRTAFVNEVVCLTGPGAVGERLQDVGIQVRTLGMHRPAGASVSLPRLAAWIAAAKPDVVQTWMYHADLFGGTAAALAGNRRLLWNIRHSRLDKTVDKPRTIRIAKLCARASHLLPQHIVCCSHASARSHEELGYVSRKFSIIPNGFNTELFRPDSEARASVRRELRIPPEARVIGIVARYHPVKDHQSFITAASILQRSLSGVHFLMCGEGVDADNRALMSLIDSAGIASSFHLTGKRTDVQRILAALDVCTLCSLSEGFPNVLGESMACGVPCVSTDVGDAALIVGDTGRVVPAAQPEALARAWWDLLSAEPSALSSLGVAARRRVEEQFSLECVVDQYQTLYAQVAEQRRQYEGFVYERSRSRAKTEDVIR